MRWTRNRHGLASDLYTLQVGSKSLNLALPGTRGEVYAASEAEAKATRRHPDASSCGQGPQNVTETLQRLFHVPREC